MDTEAPIIPNMDTELLKPKEAADYLKISKKSLDGIRYRKQITFLKVGGVIRYRKSDLDAYLQTCESK